MADTEMKHTHRPGGIHEILAIALPMVISTACDGVMTFTDRLMLARLGSEYMNAAMTGGISMQVSMFFFIGLTGYSTALVAQYLGSGRKELSAVAAFQAFLLVLVSYPVIILWLKPAAMISSYMGLSQEQQSLQHDYMLILAYGSILAMLRHVVSCYFSGIGKTRIVMAATLTAMVVNVLLDYVLIYGHFGMPQLGLRGAAIATVAGSACAVAILLLSYFGKQNRHEFFSHQSCHFDFAIMKKLLYYGYPAGLELFLNFLAFSCVIQIFQSAGETVATATTIMFNWDLVSYIPLLGIEIAVTSLVGRYMGAQQPETAKHAAYSAVKVGTMYSFIILVLFVCIPQTLVYVFSPDPLTALFAQSVPLAVSMIRIAAFYVLAEAMMSAFVGALRGAG
ncbi:MAG: MATE family efflux transporter, partial [Spirochaetota bacterium]